MARYSRIVTERAPIETRPRFAAELTAIRERAGLTIRDLAKATGLQASTLGGYFSGRHLPPLKPVDALTQILKACHVTDPVDVQWWHEALRRVRRAPGPRPASAGLPYRGLSPFQASDAQWFFGREGLTSTLVDLVKGGGDGPTLLLVVGPSGVGKSSLLRAGLIAAMDPGACLLLTPGATPVKTLSEGLESMRVVSGDPDLVVVDQFEEVFTQCPDETEQAAFVSRICALAAKPSRTSVVLGLRADFYGRALSHPELARIAQHAQLVVGPMAEDELRQAIELPARKAGADIEPGLVELLLRDLSDPARAGQSGDLYEPGSLPLLSHALLTMWERGQGRRLTVADYAAAGGIHGAVAHTAERLYASLSEDQQDLARRLFVRLVLVRDGASDSRRRVALADLARNEDMYEVLELFVGSRLLTIDGETVEICHEALIRAWPRLHRWIEEDRAGLLVAQQVTEAAVRWSDDSRDTGALYRGTRLAIAKHWAARQDPAQVDALSREFVAASVRQERRSANRLYRTLTVLAALLVFAVGAGVVALQLRSEATRERNAAISRLVATIADRVRTKDAALAAQLSLAAYRITETTEARSSLLDASATPSATRLLGDPGVLQSVALSPDRRTLAAGGADKQVRLWDLSGPRPSRLATLRGPADTVFSVAFSPDGRTLAAAGGDRKVHLWDVTRGDAPVPLGEPLSGPAELVYSLAFSPDGATLAAGSGDKRVHLWAFGRAGRPTPLGQPLTGAQGYIQAVAFSPDGRMLAAGSADKTVRLWDFTDRDRPVPVGPVLTGPEQKVYSVAFSPDGSTLAAGSGDKRVHLWDVRDPARPVPGTPVSGPSGWVNALAFTDDGRGLAFATSASEVRLIELESRRLIASLPHPGPVTGVVFGHDGTVVTSAADGAARIWHPPWPVLPGHGGVVSAVTFNRAGLLAVGSAETQLWDAKAGIALHRAMTNSAGVSASIAHAPDGQTAAIGSWDGTIQLWDVADSRVPVRVGQPIAAHSIGPVESLAFAPDGKVLASGADDNLVRLWDVTDRAQPRLLATMDGFRSYAVSIAFRPDGQVLAAASIDKTVRLWRVTDPADPRPLGEPLAVSDHYALAVAFSPDGRTLAVGSGDRAVRLYDLTDPVRPVQIGPPLGGPTNYVFVLAFAGDGRTLAAGSTDENVWIWDVSDRRRPVATATLTVPTGAIYSVGFHPDGHTLAAGGADKTVWLWETDPARVIEQICARAGDPLTLEEWHRYVPTLEYRAPC